MTSITDTNQMHIVQFSIADDILFALDQEMEAFAREAQQLLAVKYYEMGRLTTGLAAQMAGIPRTEFFHLLSRHGISPFGVMADELEEDLHHALAASDLE